MDQRERLEIATRAVVLTARCERAYVEWVKVTAPLRRSASRADIDAAVAARGELDQARQQLHVFFDELRALGVFDEVRERVAVFSGEGKTLAEWVGISEQGMERAVAAAMAAAGLHASEVDLLLLRADPSLQRPEASS